MKSLLPEASIHGRFQPFHLGHLEYALEAFERYEYVYVGITQFHQRRLVRVESGGAVHRAIPESNPLTYFERSLLIRAALGAAGIPPDRFSIVPFPIEDPAEICEFVGTHVPALTTTYDDWNRQKIRTLEDHGYQVINLWTRDEKKFAGHDVRSCLLTGDARWRSLVPQAVATLLESWDVAARLRILHGAIEVNLDRSDG